jgi:hypothetical protein
MGLTDRPACCRGLSAHTPQTVRPCTADRPLKRTEPPEPTRENVPSAKARRTVRAGPGPFATEARTIRKPAATKTKSNTGSKRNEARTRRTPRRTGAAWTVRLVPRTVRQVRTEQKTHDPESQLPQIIIGFLKRLKLWRQGFGDLKSVTQGCYSPKILPPNSLNHRESQIL